LKAPAGLTTPEAMRRLERHGPNALPEEASEPWLRRLLRQFKDPLIYLLLFALVVDLSAWWLRGVRGVPVEALAIAAILILNAGLGIVQEGRAERALAELEALASPQAWVRRDGALLRLSTREIVPGDAVRLGAGDRVPADGVLGEGPGLLIDTSLLTGESLPRDSEPESELSSGTLVVRGSGWLDVLRTGRHSAMGRLAHLLTTLDAQPTPLVRTLEAFGARIVRWVIAVAVILATAGIVFEGLEHAGRILLLAVALAVAAVPEGLPAVLTVTLALGVERMAKRKAVVRRLATVEALGSVTIIATDKTGTLTENRLRVHSVETPDRSRALEAMVLASDVDTGNAAGDPLERALLLYASEEGVDPNALRERLPRLDVTHFDSTRKYMRVTVKGPRSYLKGAPEVLLKRCRFDDEARAEWLARAEARAAEGHKVLALAWRDGEGEEDLELAGLVVLWDPPRPGVAEAVARVTDAGIRVVMITGDHPATAAAIARRVGLPAGRTVTGAHLDAEHDISLDEVNVFARVSPEHKLRIVEALQARGEVVAMTGDGVNDAPALKRADVGVVMGQRGSDVAREASDIVLLDDDFGTIVAAVEEGRSIYTNIQKFIRNLFATNLSELLVVVVGGVGSALLALREPSGALLLPLTAAMILWVNLVTDSLPALALGVDQNPDVMAERPRPSDAPLLDPVGLSFILSVGVLLAVIPLALLLALPAWDVTRIEARTLAFHVLVIGQLLSTFQVRRLGGTTRWNPLVLLAVGLAIGLQLTWVFATPAQAFLGLAALSPSLLAIGAGAIALSQVGVEIATRFTRRREERDRLRSGTPFAGPKGEGEPACSARS
jgi:Ca2+-transporting ATPase